jgi:hypothetical protein
LALGCATSTAPRSTATATAAADPVAVQSGKLLVPAHAFQDVYYASPYAGNPHLDVPDHWGRCQVVMQTPTRFRVVNLSGSDLEVDWKASGAKAPPQAPVLGSPQIQSAAAPAAPSPIRPVAASSAPAPAEGSLPPAPVPVTAPR